MGIKSRLMQLSISGDNQDTGFGAILNYVKYIRIKDVSGHSIKIFYVGTSTFDTG